MAYTVNESYRFKKMASFARTCSTVLDVGCAQLPNEYLQNPSVTGVDINKGNLTSNYHHFIQGEVGDLMTNKEQYDGVIAGEILEHLEDPMSFLRDCRDLLANDGVLILSTPNPHSPMEWLLNITLSRKYFYTKDHLMLFPQRWLIRMLEHTGFKDVKLYSGGFPLPSIGLVPFPRPFCHQTIAVAKK